MAEIEKINSNYNYSYTHIKKALKEVDEKGLTTEEKALLSSFELDESEGVINADKPIVQAVSGYSIDSINTEHGVSLNFAGVSRNGDKLSIVLAGEIVVDAEPSFYLDDMVVLNIPADVYAKLVPDIVGYIDYKSTIFIRTTYATVSPAVAIKKVNNANKLSYRIIGHSGLAGGGTYAFRTETTFLLSENLVPQE